MSLKQEHLDLIENELSDENPTIFEVFFSKLGSACPHPRFHLEDGYNLDLIPLDEEVKRYLNVTKIRRSFRR